MKKDSPKKKAPRSKRDIAISERSKVRATGAIQSGALILTEHLLARILDTADDAIISIDQRQRIILFNNGAEKVFGWSAREILGKPLELLLPRDKARLHRQHIRDFSHSGTPARRMAERSEIAGRRKNGENFPAEASISQVDSGGSKIFTVILRDITSRRAAEELIRASLREKEVLLQEIHHRVKNNLQVVSSLLNLQSRGISDEETRRFFKESQHRVHSMALIHEQLYESADLSRIHLSAYIEQLVAFLFRAYGVSLSRVGLKTEVEDMPFEVDVAVPCGLIINELVSNSLKYAFPEGRQGEIRIDLQCAPKGEVTLAVGDDGIGFPPGVSLLNTRTLGLRLVRSLAQQLGGRAELKSGSGSQVRIRFSLKAGKG